MRCARGITRAPVHQTSWIGDHYHPEGAAHCTPIVPLPPIRNSSPLQNEGASHSERGALTATSSCCHSPFLPRFYPVLLRFYPTFTPLLPRSASLFYPVFTLFLPCPAPSFLTPFYPIFTPFVKGKMPNLPRFYPTFTPPPVFTLSSVLPRFYPVPSTLHTPIPRFYPRGKTAHFLLVSVPSWVVVQKQPSCVGHSF